MFRKLVIKLNIGSDQAVTANEAMSQDKQCQSLLMGSDIEEVGQQASDTARTIDCLD